MAGGLPSGIDVPVGEGEDLAGRELADAAAVVLSACDRNAGPVSVRTIVDALMRRGRLSGDPAFGTTQIMASLRADNLRRAAVSQRPRFRFASSSRIALTDWALGPDLARLELDVIQRSNATVKPPGARSSVAFRSSRATPSPRSPS